MKLTVLVDNHTYIDQYFFGEPGASYYIEDCGKKILFDTGYSDILIKNAEKMGIDLGDLDYIVISHGHDDHTKGLKYMAEKFDLTKIKLIAHPDCFLPKFFGEDYIGSPFDLDKIKETTDFEPHKEPFNITENIIFLGEIERTNDFENKRPLGVVVENGNEKGDYLFEDSAIVYKTENGIFVITGCSHSGICNIIEYAKKVSGDDRILGVIGGFHLFKTDEILDKTVKYLESCSIKDLYPCHCVSLKARAKMMQSLNVHEVGVGMKVQL